MHRKKKEVEKTLSVVAEGGRMEGGDEGNSKFPLGKKKSQKARGREVENRHAEVIQNNRLAPKNTQLAVNFQIFHV